MPKKKILLLLVCLLSLKVAAYAGVSISNLRCEMLNNPVGIDTESPRVSWRISSSDRGVTQLSYQILVASSMQKLNAGEGDVWNSDIVKSSQSQWIIYAGQPLKSNGRYFWKVQVTTNTGDTSWSEPAQWSMGLLSENDWKAQWIGLDKLMPWDSDTQFSRMSARYLRKEFTPKKKIAHATVHISGLGLYELYINGQKVGDRVLAPAPTDYRKTTLYNSYDVTALLKDKANAMGVTLGNGRFYTMRQNFKNYKIPTFGFPKVRLVLVLEYNDGTKDVVGSDTSWKINADGPIRSNNEYDGEVYDARKEFGNWTEPGFNDFSWESAQRVTLPSGTLRAEMTAGMKVVDKIHPVSITELPGKKYILDMGQNMAGWLRIKVKGDAGDTVRLRFAEVLQKNGELYMEPLRDAKVTNLYILKGQGMEEWAPKFVYNGFRYVEITGCKNKPSLDQFVGEVVSDEMETLGAFSCTDPIINQIYKNAFWGIRSNYKGMPVDCPQRNERQPWLGDRAVGCLGESFVMENGQLYSKWMNDINDSQREDGCIPDVAPSYLNYYTDNITWPSVFLLSSDMVYSQFGNIQPIVKNYDAMKKWMDHMKKEYLREGIMTRDEYGDWCVPPESPELIHSKDPKRQTDGLLVSTAYYYKMLALMSKFATLQNKAEDAKEFDAIATNVKNAFNKKYFNTDSLFYGNNSATSNLLPLAFGMVPNNLVAKVSKQIVDKVINDSKGHICTGLVGSQWIMRELCKMGRADVAYMLASNDTYPSWGYMVKKGATTIWELWNGDTAGPKMNSKNHVMLLGDLIPFFYENMAGIKTDEKEAGFKKIIMKPNFEIQDLSDVDASYMTPYGKVVSKWKKNLKHLDWNITIPANATAIVYLPSDKAMIKEGGIPVAKAKGVKYLGKEGYLTRWEVGSGDYSFSVDMNVGQGAWRKGIVEDEFLYENASFPQAHAATIADTPTGLVASFFGGTKEGNPDVCIWVCRKTAEGWTAPQKVADGIMSDTLRKACYNPVLFQVPGGELLLFFKIGKNVGDWTGYLIRSFDGGKTWTQREELPKNILGPIKNKPVLIGNKLVCPTSTEGEGWKVHFEFTEDKGKTWRETQPINDGKTVNAIQPSILFHKDRSLQILCRTRNSAIAEAWSKDGGETWSEMKLIDLPNNNSGTDAVTLKDGRQALIYNHVKTPEGAKKGARTPLNIAVSKDGKKWFASLILEDSPIGQYSYPSIIQGNDGYIHAIYTWRRQRIKYMKIDPKQLKEVPIVNGQWPALDK
ncbi:family 78 glycoside hydrolase catalytic domain [uncultured Bacteroides sp.]|uniref:family 78 glycoside hydrolase catalytic domain n=1 Tax=uncultured Bacteroides sp. TaxID=162156 RepID=UPI002AAB0212|nr:family 78 glycoside hydrolase catalytic domain [uncultured Bacteroides sp.]